MGWAIALHGGAGDIPPSLPPERRLPREETLCRCLRLGVAALKDNRSPLDVVELAVRELENCPQFNAGRGSVLTTNATVEMEACIMEGNTKRCGAVSGLSTVVNAISLARLVMEKTPHIYLAFDGAETFAREQVCLHNRSNKDMWCLDSGCSRHMTGDKAKFTSLKPKEGEYVIFGDNNKGKIIGVGTIGKDSLEIDEGVEILDASHFITPENIERLTQAKTANRVQIDYTRPALEKPPQGTSSDKGDSQIGTVGCVAVDGNGNLAAATSTGGLVNKMVGRIGDTPIVGAGTYANSVCAVSATGKGEAIIRATVGRDVAALVEYKGLSLKEAADYVVENAPKGTTGLIAVSANGDVAMPFNTTGMFRACAKEDGTSEIAIWHSMENGRPEAL